MHYSLGDAMCLLSRHCCEGRRAVGGRGSSCFVVLFRLVRIRWLRSSALSLIFAVLSCRRGGLVSLALLKMIFVYLRLIS